LFYAAAAHKASALRSRTAEQKLLRGCKKARRGGINLGGCVGSAEKKLTDKEILIFG
jgi:hypothetical protein